MYGFVDELTARTKQNELRQRDTLNRYEVTIHKHPENNIWGRGDKSVTYGVQRFIPYTPTMPWKFDGFVWF
jgi:hypothetical protein